MIVITMLSFFFLNVVRLYRTYPLDFISSALSAT